VILIFGDPRVLLLDKRPFFSMIELDVALIGTGMSSSIMTTRRGTEETS
jgi:hypothetical protein